MKRLTNLLLVLMLIPSFVISQNYNKTKSIKLNYPIQDFSRKTKSLEVIDLRAEEEIGKIVYRGNYYAFSFPTNNAKNDIENWYRKQNKKEGINDIVMLIEDFNIKNTMRDNTIYCNLDIKMSTFLKTSEGYYFLSRFDDVLGLDSKVVSGLPNSFVENIAKILQKLLSDSYSAKPRETLIPFDQLKNYETIMYPQIPALANADLKDGVYTDFKSFFQQEPKEGYQMLMEDEEFTKAVNPITKDKIPARKIFAFVKDAKAFKNTALGFKELQKDDNGFYLYANRGILYPEEFKVSPWFFVGFGIIGYTVAATVEVISNDVKNDKAQAADKNNVYIDPFMGTYSFNQ
ncbi:hypothetical protein [Chryseobacterium sp. POL2]|uniref:hypothetical protein n=1 Tax=Chryseobacterium sp. POL2 TaxID=2713414 RepID=UPI0013E19BC9|nr:hypothetical protein [Chryseobacterium sp. POL2]QIG90129.1 hypothetical protein G6R40_10860 [Chryseobacterium sp. POL2]